MATQTFDSVEAEVKAKDWGADKLAQSISSGHFGSDASYKKRAAVELLEQIRAAEAQAGNREARELERRAVAAQERAAKSAKWSMWAAVASAIAAGASALPALMQTFTQK